MPQPIPAVANCTLMIKHEAGKEVLLIKLKKGLIHLPIFRVERLKKENINTVITQYKALTPSILFTNHLSIPLAKKLHDNKVQFIDLSGNIFIDNPLGYIFIKGEKKGYSKSISSSPFSTAGIKVIFALLSNPQLEKEPYRTISKIANVSLGSVETIMRNLAHHNFLLFFTNNERKLINKAELLNRWCIAFSERLQSKLIISRLSCDNQNWWKEVKLDPAVAVWGGEVAAAKLTQYLKPEIISLYAFSPLPELQVRFRLRKDERGSIVIYKKFWDFPTEKDEDLAPKILIYAELINSGDSRNAETARIIYEKYLSKIVE